MKNSFEIWARKWSLYKNNFVKSSTHAMYIFMIEKHLIPFFNERATIMEIDVQEFVDRQLEAGHSVKTVKGMVTVLRMIAVYASKQKGCLPPVGWQLNYNAGALAAGRPRTCSMSRSTKRW